MSEETHHPSRDIAINSNWIMTIGMALVFVLCAAFLMRDIWLFRSNRLHHVVPLAYALLAAYYFVLASWFPSKYVKTAFFLLGTDLTVRIVMGRLAIPTGVELVIATVTSIAHMVAFILILVAIVQWFRSVTR